MPIEPKLPPLGDYKQENKTAKARGERGGSDADHAKRMRARRAYEKEHGELPSSVHVDHKKHLRDGGSNGKSNLRARPARENMKDNDHKGRNHHSKRK